MYTQDIAVYPKQSPSRSRLEQAAVKLSQYTGCDTMVADCAFDVSLNWNRTTVLLRYPDESQWIQILSPKDQFQIVSCESADANAAIRRVADSVRAVLAAKSAGAGKRDVIPFVLAAKKEMALSAERLKQYSGFDKALSPEDTVKSAFAWFDANRGKLDEPFGTEYEIELKKARTLLHLVTLYTARPV